MSRTNTTASYQPDRTAYHVVTDPMLATGGSAVEAIDLSKHAAERTSNHAIIAAPEGLKRLHEAHPDVQIYVGHVDRCLNENAYICRSGGWQGIGFWLRNKSELPTFSAYQQTTFS